MMKLKSSVQLLKTLQHKEGLFIAAPSDKTGYSKAWIRDNIYASFGMEVVDREAVIKMMHKLFDIFRKHEYKLDWAIREKPKHAYQYIHARYDPETLEEYNEEWGNKQNDAIGAFLFRAADLHSKGYWVIRDEADRRIVEKLVLYLESVEYWKDKDNGMWEENEEVHASSVGACLAGLRAVASIVYVPLELIKKGEDALNNLLLRESETKECDLALLSLIYPYNIVSKEMAELILKNVEDKLVRERGVIRYVGDKYYNIDGEAEWTMGFAWLAIIYKALGNKEKYQHYMKKTVECFNEEGGLPELYYSNSCEHNENSPLGWAQSLYIVAAL
jgi:phosphorylase kinase alpha/beta subunit